VERSIISEIYFTGTEKHELLWVAVKRGRDETGW